MATLIDLSAPITNGPEGVDPLFQTEIEFAGHDRGAQDIERMFGVPPELLRDREGWAYRRMRHGGCTSAGSA
jgi:hypothetical protein